MESPITDALLLFPSSLLSNTLCQRSVPYGLALSPWRLDSPGDLLSLGGHSPSDLQGAVSLGGHSPRDLQGAVSLGGHSPSDHLGAVILGGHSPSDLQGAVSLRGHSPRDLQGAVIWTVFTLSDWPPPWRPVPVPVAMADRDPLSYFAGYGSSGSESESEPEPGPGPGPAAVGDGAGGAQAQAQASASPAALPRPDELFSSVSRPSFLGRPGSGLINWEQRVVRAPEEPPREFKVWKTNAVPPPETYAVEEKKPPSGVDMAVKWSCMYQDNGEDTPQRKAALLPDEPEISESDEDDGDDVSAKKRKIETFQQKEKRKRNQGQANREKSFVEEEKRILRQEFSLKD
ncbi:UPF0690 protein C1orf52 homolog [Hemiscyllium ocellatum]|uniref:UPF0690 protein C1orf52 homolog n=1 Tax=Hemiscyllium ocellatum TaxID=170820 RepID=UPI002967722C|nr:UPF0690 protein C1orf52 homolog [Hemiscyllium ocellatum]